MRIPKIRENLMVQDLNDEILIYDKKTNRPYCLNLTGKIVFNACDGKKTLDDLNLPDEMIYFTLDELKKIIRSKAILPRFSRKQIGAKQLKKLELLR